MIGQTLAVVHAIAGDGALAGAEDAQIVHVRDGAVHFAHPLLASGAFAALKDRMDPRKHNGGVFLGLNGVVVKSHGGTDALGFATAIDVTLEIVRNDLVNKIKTDVELMTGLLKQPEAQAEASL